MKHTIIIAVSLLTITVLSCTKKSGSSSTSSTDTTFSGSYFQISYNGRYFNVKGASLNGGPVTSVTEVSSNTILVDGVALYGISGTLEATSLNVGSNNIPASGISSFTQASPYNSFLDSSGTVSVTHNGTDYVQGTFTTTLYANGFTYPATGSFKVYH